MRTKVFAVLALCFAVTACLSIEFSTQEDASIAPYRCKFKWGDDSPLYPDSVVVALARTVNSVHDTLHLANDSSDTLHVFNGDYHAVAFGTTSPDKYEIENAEAFLSRQREVGLTDLYACLKEISSSEDPLMRSLFPSNSMEIPVVTEADVAWIGATESTLKHGSVESLDFDMRDVTQTITVRLAIVNDSADDVIERIAVALIGVPSRISLLDKTVSVDHVGRALVEMQADGDDTHFIGTTKALGLFKPINSKDLYSHGVLEVAIKIADADKPVMTKINLNSFMKANPSLEAVGVTDRYRSVSSEISLDISASRTIHIDVSKESMEESSAFDIWIEDTPDSSFDIIPED